MGTDTSTGEFFTFPNLQRMLDFFTDDLVKTYKDLLIRDGKQASGNLIQSIKTLNIEFSNNVYTGSISLASYWKYVEYGRKPGKMPPRDKILEWVKVKRVLPRPQNGLKSPTQEQLAFLIQRKIGRDGIKPGNQFDEALRMTWNRWEHNISNAISEDLDTQVDMITNLIRG